MLFVISLFAFISAHLGAKLASRIDPASFRSLILVILISIAIYTYFKKDLGTRGGQTVRMPMQYFYGSLMGILIGFYDGIFGPGTGTFLVFFLVSAIGFAFLKASATAKLVNIATNAGAILSFQLTGHIWWQLGLLLAFANVTGAIIGSRLAIRGGSPLVRKVFLAVTFLLIARVAWDTFIS